MGTINLVGSLRYDMTGRKRKTKSLTTKSKRNIYKELIATQQRQYDKVVKEVAEQYPSFVSNNTTGAITPKKEPMQYTGERKLLGIAAMHKSNLVPVFEEDKEYAKDLARMRR